MKKALIIFVRKPELGKVKTRLAASVGDEKALSIYIHLLHYTSRVASRVDADVFIYYAGEIVEGDIWQNPKFTKRLQQGAELYEWLNGGASFFVCGKKDPMSFDVEKTLLQIIEMHGNKTSEEAKQYLTILEEEGRYEKDVY